MGIWGSRKQDDRKAKTRQWLEVQLQTLMVGLTAANQVTRESDFPRDGVEYASADAVGQAWAKTYVVYELLAARASAVREVTKYARANRLIGRRTEEDLMVWTQMAKLEFTTLRRDFALRLWDPSGAPFDWTSPSRFGIIAQSEISFLDFWEARRADFAPDAPSMVDTFTQTMNSFLQATGTQVPLDASPKECLERY